MEEIIPSKYSTLDAADYCQALNGFWLMAKRNLIQISAVKMADKANY